jgi:hypothetical protein
MRFEAMLAAQAGDPVVRDRRLLGAGDVVGHRPGGPVRQAGLRRWRCASQGKDPRRLSSRAVHPASDRTSATASDPKRPPVSAWRYQSTQTVVPAQRRLLGQVLTRGATDLAILAFVADHPRLDDKLGLMARRAPRDSRPSRTTEGSVVGDRCFAPQPGFVAEVVGQRRCSRVRWWPADGFRHKPHRIVQAATRVQAERAVGLPIMVASLSCSLDKLVGGRPPTSSTPCCAPRTSYRRTSTPSCRYARCNAGTDLGHWVTNWVTIEAHNSEHPRTSGDCSSSSPVFLAQVNAGCWLPGVQGVSTFGSGRCRWIQASTSARRHTLPWISSS